MKPFDPGSTPRASLATALKFVAYCTAASEHEGRDLFHAVVAGARHPKLNDLLKRLETEIAAPDLPLQGPQQRSWTRRPLSESSGIGRGLAPRAVTGKRAGRSRPSR